jgi:MFS family permease
MTVSAPGVADRAWLWPLVVTLLMQTVAAFLIRALSVMGPSVTRAAGVPPENVGHLAGLTAGGTMLFVAMGILLLKRLGPVRTLQLGALVGAAAMLAVASASWPVMLLAALAIGVGYGPSPPAGSDILSRYAPPGRRSLLFSVKQSGVPLGGVLAGLVLPPALAAFGWRWALVIGSLISIAAALVVQPLRAAHDRDRERLRAISLRALCSRANFQAPFTVLREAPGLGPLTATGFAFACVQGCLLTFLVTYLVEEAKFSLTSAGFAFSAAQFAGFIARIAMGWVADRIKSGPLTLLALAGGGFGTMLAVAAINPGWSLIAVIGVSIAAGCAATSWNGVYLAEVARLAPAARVSEATAGSTFFVFIAYSVAPVVFATAVSAVGSYRAAFAGVALIPLAVIPVLWPLVRRTRVSGGTP